MSLKWHPDKHTTDRRLAERKFQDVSEAFDVLSDPNRRSTYDRMISEKSSLENAYKVFDKFFG
jgi:DnaJ family protein B protein 4